MAAAQPLTVIQGSSKHPEEAAEMRRQLENSEMAGTLIIGYPPGVDAVLVSGHGHVTVFHLDMGTGEDAEEAQDRAWHRIDLLLASDRTLRDGRRRLVVPQSLTVAHGPGARERREDPEHPVTTPDRLLDTLRAQHANPVPGPPVTHDAVVEAVLRMPQAL